MKSSNSAMREFWMQESKQQRAKKLRPLMEQSDHWVVCVFHRSGAGLSLLFSDMHACMHVDIPSRNETPIYSQLFDVSRPVLLPDLVNFVFSNFSCFRLFVCTVIIDDVTWFNENSETCCTICFDFLPSVWSSASPIFVSGFTLKGSVFTETR